MQSKTILKTGDGFESKAVVEVKAVWNKRDKNPKEVATTILKQWKELPEDYAKASLEACLKFAIDNRLFSVREFSVLMFPTTVSLNKTCFDIVKNLLLKTVSSSLESKKLLLNLYEQQEALDAEFVKVNCNHFYEEYLDLLEQTLIASTKAWFESEVKKNCFYQLSILVQKTQNEPELRYLHNHAMCVLNRMHYYFGDKQIALAHLYLPSVYDYVISHWDQNRDEAGAAKVCLILYMQHPKLAQIRFELSDEQVHEMTLCANKVLHHLFYLDKKSVDGASQIKTDEMIFNPYKFIKRYDRTEYQNEYFFSNSLSRLASSGYQKYYDHFHGVFSDYPATFSLSSGHPFFPVAREFRKCMPVTQPVQKEMSSHAVAMQNLQRSTENVTLLDEKDFDKRVSEEEPGASVTMMSVSVKDNVIKLEGTIAGHRFVVTDSSPFTIAMSDSRNGFFAKRQLEPTRLSRSISEKVCHPESRLRGIILREGSFNKI